jgi:hypothetical protein
MITALQTFRDFSLHKRNSNSKWIEFKSKSEVSSQLLVWGNAEYPLRENLTTVKK